MNKAIDLAERGLVPDFLLRQGIKGLLRQRLREQRSEEANLREEKFKTFVRSLGEGPIAVETDAANEQHYEVPADFFRIILGPRLKYSSCFWDESTPTLREAEEKALSLTCAHAGIADGMEILDIGCGWGSLSLWIAEHYPNSKITAVSNSQSQGDFIRNEAKRKGLSNISVNTSDINDYHPDSVFDRVVSVEAFEHMRNYEELLRRIGTWLKPEGKLFVHIFCHREYAYPFETEGDDNWMGKNFFTGGIMPSDDLLLQFQKHLRVEHQWRWNGLHYARTLRAWLSQLDQNRGQAISILSHVYGEESGRRWFYRWRIFLHACAELFAFNKGDEWWVSHYLFANTDSADNGRQSEH